MERLIARGTRSFLFGKQKDGGADGGESTTSEDKHSLIQDNGQDKGNRAETKIVSEGWISFMKKKTFRNKTEEVERALYHKPQGTYMGVQRRKVGRVAVSPVHFEN